MLLKCVLDLAIPTIDLQSTCALFGIRQYQEEKIKLVSIASSLVNN